MSGGVWVFHDDTMTYLPVYYYHNFYARGGLPSLII